MTNITMHSLLLLSVISLVFISSSRLVSCQLCREQDKLTLLKIKSSFGYSSSLETWNNSTNCCFFWDGVYCDVFTGKILHLWITNSNTTGTIPSSISELPDLIRLNILGHPNLTGPIPESITKLRNLERLAICGTSLSGNIPKFLCNMSKLYSLDLSYNDLYGSIPDCFPSSVHIINLNYNRLSGHIPGSLMRGYGGNDTVLNLKHNQFTGKIPRSFRTLSFDNLDLSENQFTGDASVVLGSPKFSNQIDLSNNKFEFDLSPVTYPLYLALLDLSHNRIRGSINQQITELQWLGVLDMSDNRLCGPIPTGPGMRAYDPSTFAQNKCLCGTPLPPCTKNCKGSESPLLC